MRMLWSGFADTALFTKHHSTVVRVRASELSMSSSPLPAQRASHLQMSSLQAALTSISLQLASSPDPPLRWHLPWSHVRLLHPFESLGSGAWKLALSNYIEWGGLSDADRVRLCQ